MTPDWLRRESERWTADGLITPEQRRAILARYPDDPSSFLGRAALSWLAWLVGGFGLILLVAWNWEGLPHGVKIGGTLACVVAAYAAAVVSHRRGKSVRAELLAFAGALLAGALIAAVTDLLRPGNTSPWPALVWAAAIAGTALVAASPTTTALGAGVLLFWVLADTGRPPASWMFLLVFPVLAIALERRTNWFASGMASLALGGWVALTALETWRTPASAAGVFFLAAGAALDAWAHRPAGRRPSFASATPGLAFMIAGFGFMTAQALARSAPGPMLGEPAVTMPVIALLVALLAVACWPVPGMGFGRAQVAGASGVVWAVLWALTAPGTPAPEWWSWFWLVASSAGLVGLTVSAVSESAITRNRVTLVAGISAMLMLILVHVTAGPNRFGRSALVLFVAAGALWWSTTRHKSSPDQPEL